MTIYFYEPPPAQKVGGLDAAIQGMRAALQTAGCAVEINAPLPDKIARDECLAHFHGLWQPAHASVMRQCRARGIRYIVSPHGMLEPWAWRHKWWKKWLYFQGVEKKNLDLAQCLMATGESEAEQLRRFAPRQNILVLPLGLTGQARPDYAAARAALGWQPHQWRLLFLSRIHRKKGLDLLLHALANLQGRLPADMHLTVVGGGDAAYIASVQELARRRQSELPPIEWIGEVWGDERWKYFQGADLFCLPTHSENFGLAILEACQVGTPVLSTTTTPWSRPLQEQGCFIAEPRVDAVERALLNALAKRWTLEQRASLADWAWQGFHWDTLAPRYLDAYQQVLNQPMDA